MKFCFEKRDFIELDIRPEALALAGSDRDLSWSEFKVEVDQWHTAFVAKSWTKLGGPVIIYGHKNTTMVAAIYGCIRAGIPYIPIDVVYPKDRIASIIDISKSQIIINTEAEKLGLGAMIEVASPRDITEHVGEVILDNNPNPNKLVYIIFTSGSTGAPKGVQISLEAILSFVRWMTSDFGFKEGSVFINSAIFSFDLSVFELMTFSALGGTLLMNTKEQAANPQTFLQRIHDYQGNIWVSTPSFALLFSKMPPATQLSRISDFLFCGETLPHKLAQNLVSKYPTAAVWNTYGPTEATVATTQIKITQSILEKHNPLPVGNIKPECEIKIEDGEITIVGPHVSHGYVGLDALNQEKFISVNGQRAFRTGDGGFFESELLFFTGRNDDLVKLHGYRIELNEITANLELSPNVDTAATLALKRNGEVKKIVAFITLKDTEHPFSRDQLSADLLNRIPPYMVPSDIRVIGQIPLNQNGKADKKVLLDMYLKKES